MSYHEVNNSVRSRNPVVTPLSVVDLSTQFGSERHVTMGTFGSELLAAAVAGTEAGRASAATCSRAGGAAVAGNAMADVGRGGRASRIHRARNQLAVVTSGCRLRTWPTPGATW